MSIRYAFAMLCAIGMVGLDDQPAKRPSDAETRRIEAVVQAQAQVWEQLQGQLQLQQREALRFQIQAEVHLLMEQRRRMEEQRVHETRRARIAEARMRSAVEAVGGPSIGESFRSSRRQAGRP